MCVSSWCIGLARSYDDLSALVVDINIRVRYQLSRRTALLAGLNYLSADVEILDPDSITDIRYAFDGLFVGFDVNF